MAKRPMCLLCFLMVLSLGALELMGIPLIRGNPLPLNVQEQIEAYPGSMICGEVEQYENTEFSQSVYLKKTYLIHQSKKFPIENVRIFLKKEEDLKAYFRQLKSVAVAFSGGVDSTYLLKTAHDTLGDQVIAVTAKSCSFPERELKEAIHFCEKEGIRHFVCESEELDIEGFSHNPKNRCYICKHELFEKIINIAKKAPIWMTTEITDQGFRQWQNLG